MCELHVQDMRRARAFYERVLATKLSDFESPTDLEMLAFAREDRAVELGRVEKAASTAKNRRSDRTASWRSRSIPKAIASACIRCADRERQKRQLAGVAPSRFMAIVPLRTPTSPLVK